MTIDFTPTAYTVKDPGNGEQRRYTEDERSSYAIETARRHFIELTEEYPALARFVVPDHYVQEYCRAYDNNLYGGGGGYGVDRLRPFLRLADRGAEQAKFN